MSLGPRFLRWRIVRPSGPMDVEFGDFERDQRGIKRMFFVKLVYEFAC